MLGLLLALTQPVCDMVWRDEPRRRDVPVRIRPPAGSGPAPVILFSHGLGGTLDAGAVWGEAWAEAGFLVIHIQHPGSDARAVRRNGQAAAAGPAQMIARAYDVSFVLDALAARRTSPECGLNRADLAHVGMSGHSFGAETALALAGQSFRGDRSELREPRIDAVIGFSPAPPLEHVISDARSYHLVTIPAMTVTGSKDYIPFTVTVPLDRRRPFDAMPAGGKYLLWFDGANHGTTGGFPGRAANIDQRIRPATIRLTTLFWRWTLLRDAAAKAKLDQGDPSLGPRDRLEKR